MSADPRLTSAAANAAADAVTALIDASGDGTIKIYDGTIPTDADTAIGSQTLLATLTFSSTSFGSASAGVSTANSITSGTAVATGTASWARIADGGGTTVMDCTVGTSGEDINLNTVAISSGASVSVTSMTYTQQKT